MSVIGSAPGRECTYPVMRYGGLDRFPERVRTEGRYALWLDGLRSREHHRRRAAKLANERSALDYATPRPRDRLCRDVGQLSPGPPTRGRCQPRDVQPPGWDV